MAVKTLDDICSVLAIDPPLSGSDTPVLGVTMNHRKVRQGDIFVAIQGARAHGANFARDAVSAGAVAVLSDVWLPDCGAPLLLSPNPKSLVGRLCNAVYGEAEVKLWGVTGTNGKTSTATYLFHLLERLQRRAALSGSTGFIPAGEISGEGLTTPEADVLHRQIREWQLNGVTDVVLEVSAQALARHRVDGLVFDVAGFTNLSHDHLDEFFTMDAYAATKASLFTSIRARRAVITVDDQFGRAIFEDCSLPKTSIGETADLVITHAPFFALEKRGGPAIRSRLQPGKLMAKNLGLAVGMLLESGYSAERLESALENFDLEVPGRLQKLADNADNHPAVFLDYAHTPDAIEQAIAELRARGFSFVTVIFSASGDRDHSKRPEMSTAASSANLVVVTDFHPRSEDPGSIRSELTAQLKLLDAEFTDIADPGQAIAEAVKLTPNEGVVLWCGPGHLKYREVSGAKLPFDPAAEVARALEEKS